MDKELLKKINIIVEDYIIYLHRKNALFLSNAAFFYHLNKDLALEAKEIEYENIKMSGYDTFKLVCEFYKKYYPEDLKKINTLFEDGTIDIYYYDELKEEQIYIDYYKNQFRQGFDRDHLYINIPLEGIILDYQRVIHEIRHFLNCPKEGRKIFNDTLTEGLSIFDELIALDFMCENFGNIAHILKNNYIVKMLNLSKYACFISKVVLLKDKLGEINEENYKLLYDETGLDDFIKLCNDVFSDIDSYEDINADICNWYSFGAMIALFMYKNYKEDENYLNKFKELNKAMLENKEIVECLEIVNIDLLSDDIIDILKSNAIEQANLINKQATKQNAI